MTTNALVPVVSGDLAFSSLPQLYLLRHHQPSGEGDAACTLLSAGAGSPERTINLFAFGEDQGFVFNNRHLPQPELWRGRGYWQKPPCIRSNLRFSGTYGSEGNFLAHVSEKGTYIDLFS